MFEKSVQLFIKSAQHHEHETLVTQYNAMRKHNNNYLAQVLDVAA